MRRRRRRRRLAVVLGGALVVLVALYASRNQVLLPQLAGLAGRFAERAGYELVLEDFGGSLVRTLHVGRVRLTARQPDLALELVEVDGVELTVDWLRLVRGDPFAVRALVAERVAVRVVSGAKDADEAPDGTGGGMPDLGRRLPRIDLAHVELSFPAGDGTRVEVRGGRVRVGAPDGQDRQPLEVRVGELAWIEGERASGAPLLVEGTWRVGNLRIDALELGDFDAVELVTADLSEGHRGKASGELALALGGGRIDAEARLEGGRLRGSSRVRGFDAALAAEELRAAGVPPLTDLLADAVLPSGPWRIDATLERDPGGARRAGARVSTGELDWYGRRIQRLELEVALDGERLDVRSFDVADAANHIALRDVTIDLGAASAAELLDGSGGRLRVDLNDVPGLIAPGRDAPFALPEHRVSAVAALEEDRLRVLEGRFDTPGGSVVLERGSATLVVGDAPLSGGRRKLSVRYAAAGEARFETLEPLTAILASGPFAGALRGSLALEGTDADADARAELVGEGVTAAGWELGDVELAVEMGGGRLEVERLIARRDGELLEASGAVRLFDPRGGDAPLTFENWRANARLDATWARLGRDVLPGLPAASGVAVELEADGPWTALEGVVRARAEDVRVGDETFDDVALDLVARPFDGNTGVEVTVERAEATSAYGRLALLGSARYDHPAAELEARLAEFSIARGDDQLALERPVVYRWAAGAHSLERAGFSGSAGAFDVAVEGPPDALAIAVGASDLDLAPFVGRFLPADLELWGLDVEGRVLLGGAAGVREFALVTSLAHVRPAAGRPAAALEIEAAWEGDVLRVERLLVTTDAGDRVTADGTVPLALGPRPLAPGPLDVRFEADAAALASWLIEPITEGVARLELALDGSWNDVRGTVRAEVSDLALAAPDSPMGALGRIDGRAAVRLDGDGDVTVEAVAVNAHAGAWFEAAGTARVVNDVVAWIEDPGGSYRALTVDLAGEAEVPELAWLVPLTPGVRTLDGRAQLLDLSLQGHPSSLDRRGRLVVERGLLKLDADVPAISDLEGELRLGPGEGEASGAEVLTFDDLTATLGGAPIALDGSTTPFGPDPRVDLHLVGEGVLLYRTPDTMVRADAELRLVGPLNALSLSGVIEPTSARFTRNVNFLNIGRGRRTPSSGGRGIELFSFRNEPLASMTFDIRVRAREPFRIDNNFANGALLPDLTLRGTGEVPVLQGPIYLQPTTVALPATRLRFTGGTIVFEREDPFVPQLNLRGETRMRGYDISIQLLGPYDDPEILMSSVPPLPPQDVAVLVATGQLPESALTAEGGARTARVVALYLAQDLSSQFFGDDGGGDEESFFERFEVTTGRDVSRTGQETIEGSFRLWEGGFAKSDQGLISVERDVYDDFNFGLRFVWRFK